MTTFFVRETSKMRKLNKEEFRMITIEGISDGINPFFKKANMSNSSNLSLNFY